MKKYLTALEEGLLRTEAATPFVTRVASLEERKRQRGSERVRGGGKERWIMVARKGTPQTHSFFPDSSTDRDFRLT